MLRYPNIDPTILHIYGPLQIRWYSLGYVIGILLGAFLVNLELKRNGKIIKSLFDEMITYLTIGIVIGGRLFYVLFYNTIYYFRNPIKIFYLWDGGMSFHGGLVGVIVAIIILGYRKKINPGEILDLSAIFSTIGLFLVRIANFINSELYGRETKIWCSFIFPTDYHLTPRHPSQLYEAFGEGFLIFIVLFVLYKKTKIYNTRWMLSSLFLILYGIIRFFIEFTREPDMQIGFIAKYFTIGQVLCLFMFLSGVCLFIYLKLRHKKIMN